MLPSQGGGSYIFTYFQHFGYARTFLMRVFCFAVFMFFAVGAFAGGRNISESEFTNSSGENVKVTATSFEPGEQQEFEEFVEEIEKTTDQTVVVKNTSKPVDKWFHVFKKNNDLRRTLFHSRRQSEDFDKVGAYVALFRTAYSSVFWIYISDFSVMQSFAMIGMQAAIHYSFTYRGVGLNILEFSKKLSGHVADEFGYTKLKYKKSFNTGVRYFTSLVNSNVIGAGFIAILAWENVEVEFSQFKTYVDIAYYSVMGVFSTGGWNSFLAEQKFSTHPVISQPTVHRIFQFNGAVMAVAFPLMMNGYVAGHVMLATMGVTGVITAFTGHELLLWRQNRRPVCSQVFASI